MPLMTNHKNRRTGFVLSGLVMAMIGLSFASVPLYRLFCQVTGFGRTPQRAIDNANHPHFANRLLTIRFNADTDPSLAWKFAPVQSHMQVVIGETELAFYQATNLANQAITGQATFNVTPDKAGRYFYKIACFCFDQQTLHAHQSVDMPVSFYIDPEFLNDPDMVDVKTITLSYTFFRAPDGVQSTSQLSQPPTPAKEVYP